jgi:pimeloyl-ACP methyl ester carboxylesterase
MESGLSAAPMLRRDVDHVEMNAGEVRLHCAAVGPRDGPRVERIPDASHWVQADAPDRVNELLLSLLR